MKSNSSYVKKYKFLSQATFVLGFASIIGSIAIWYLRGGQSADPFVLAHAERFGIFVGLWAPTFFILSNRFALIVHAKETGETEGDCCKTEEPKKF